LAEKRIRPAEGLHKVTVLGAVASLGPRPLAETSTSSKPSSRKAAPRPGHALVGTTIRETTVRRRGARRNATSVNLPGILTAPRGPWLWRADNLGERALKKNNSASWRRLPSKRVVREVTATPVPTPFFRACGGPRPGTKVIEHRTGLTMCGDPCAETNQTVATRGKKAPLLHLPSDAQILPTHPALSLRPSRLRCAGHPQPQYSGLRAEEPAQTAPRWCSSFFHRGRTFPFFLLPQRFAGRGIVGGAASKRDSAIAARCFATGWVFGNIQGRFQGWALITARSHPRFEIPHCLGCRAPHAPGGAPGGNVPPA